MTAQFTILTILRAFRVRKFREVTLAYNFWLNQRRFIPVLDVLLPRLLRVLNYIITKAFQVFVKFLRGFGLFNVFLESIKLPLVIFFHERWGVPSFPILYLIFIYNNDIDNLLGFL